MTKSGNKSGIFDGILLCTDYDGTLATGGKIVDANRSAILRFMDMGGLFTVASGRAHDFLTEKCADCMPNTHLICINGSRISSRDGVTLWARPLVSPPLEQLIATVAGNPLYEQANILLERETISLRPNAPDFRERLYALAAKTIYKIVLVTCRPMTDLEAQSLTHAMGEAFFFIARSWNAGIEILEKGADKGEAALALKEMTGADTLVCIGDYENDIPMLRAADIGYAVGDAIPAAIEAADRITVRAEEGAVAAVIRELEKERTRKKDSDI